MRTTFIYALKDPDTNLIRYIGKSDDPEKRLSVHLCCKGRNHRVNWVRSLTKAGMSPVLEILDEVPIDEWMSWEVAYIEFFRELGFSLVNETQGGEGATNPTPESINRRVQSRKGYSHPPEARQKTRVSVKKSWAVLTPEEKEARVKHQKERGFTGTGRKATPQELELKRYNQTGKKSDKSPSRYIGVFRYRSPIKPWRALIYVNTRQLHIGLFSSELEAAHAYDIAAKHHFGDRAKLNFPNP